MKPRSSARLALPLASAITALLAAPTAHATTYYWDVNGNTSGFSTVVGGWNGTNAFWGTSSSGSGGSYITSPTSADDLFIPQATTKTGNLTVTGTKIGSSITFMANVGPTVNVTGGTIQIGGTGASSGIFNASSGANTIASALTLNSAVTSFNLSNSAAGTLKIGNVTGLASTGTTQTVTIGASSNGALTLNGAFSDSGTGGKVALYFNSTGTGIATLQAASSYTGGTTFAAGTVIANTASTLPTSGGVVFSGGTLQVPLSGWATSEIDTLLGASTKTSGKLALDTTTSGNQTQWAAFTTSNFGGLGLTKAGTNTLTLDQTNTYTGATTISAGTLQVGSGGSTGSIDNTASVFIAASSTLLFNRTGTINAGYVISGGGTTSTVTLTGGGTLALSNTTNTFQGPFNVQNGTVSFSVWNGNSSNGPLGGGDGSKLILGSGTGGVGTLEYTNSDTPTTNRSFTLTAGGTGVVQIDNAAANVNMSLGAGSPQVTGAGNLIKTGPGALTLSKSLNNYTGTTTIQAGSLVAGTDSFGTGTSGAFGNSSAGALILGNGSTGASDAPALINGGFTVGRDITVGSVSNVASYNATIGGSNTTGTSYYTGNITLNTTAANYTATLQAATGGTVEFNTGTWTTNNKAIAIGSSGNLGTVKLSNNIATTGGINVNYGTLILNSALTGGMTVASGATLTGAGTISGAVSVNGILSPGPAIAQLGSGALTLNNNSTFAYDMDSSVVGNNQGSLQVVNGNLILNGHINLTLSASAFTPNTTTLSLMQYTGSLLGSGGFFYGATALTDGTTFNDGLNTWRISYAAPTGGLNFANELGGKFITLSNLTAVPEPGTLLALGCLLGSGAFLRTRRRH